MIRSFRTTTTTTPGMPESCMAGCTFASTHAVTCATSRSGGAGSACGSARPAELTAKTAAMAATSSCRMRPHRRAESREQGPIEFIAGGSPFGMELDADRKRARRLDAQSLDGAVAAQRLDEKTLPEPVDALRMGRIHEYPVIGDKPRQHAPCLDLDLMGRLKLSFERQTLIGPMIGFAGHFVQFLMQAAAQ